MLSDRGRAAVLLTIQGVGLATAMWTGTAPPVVPVDAPRSAFSGARALDRLTEILGDAQPRPTGSSANHAARGRIVTHLRTLGYEPEVQSVFICGPYRNYCGEVHNIVARIPGAGHGKVVLLNAHYDSQAATPGAADCMAGVAAILEIAAAFRADPPLSDVILLINDGEEVGLLGAWAFVQQHRWAREVTGVINLEARGSDGPSWPVYSVGGDLEWMRAYLRTAERPAPGSLALAATAGLPLANDIAVFQGLGVPGVTMGFARHPRRYHTAADDLAHLSPRSLQQHGANAMALARAMGATTQISSAKGVFLAIGPVHLAWPASRSLEFALFAAGLLLLAIAAAIRQKRVSVRHLAWGLLWWPVIIAATFFAAASLNALRRTLTETPSANVSFPLPSFLGFCFVGLGGVLLWEPLVRRTAGESGQWLGAWIWWAGLTVFAVVAAPQAAYPLLAPLMIASVAAIGVSFGDARVRLGTAAITSLVVCLVWYPNMVVLYDLLGLGNLPPVAGLIAVAAISAMPLVVGRAGRNIALGTATAGLILVGWGTRVATFTEDDPQFANVLYHLDADSATARYAFTGFPLPSSMAAAATFSDDPVRLMRWSPQDAGATAPAPAVQLAPPQFNVSTVARGDSLTISGRLVSPRGARVAQLVFPDSAAPSAVMIAGQLVPPDAAPFPLYSAQVRVYTIWTLPPQGVDVTLRSGRPMSGVTLVDRSDGLPDAARSLIAARPDWSTPVGPGDQTIVTVSARLTAESAARRPQR